MVLVLIPTMRFPAGHISHIIILRLKALQQPILDQREEDGVHAETARSNLQRFCGT